MARGYKGGEWVEVFHILCKLMFRSKGAPAPVPEPDITSFFLAVVQRELAQPQF